MMVLLFWISTILLVLASLGGSVEGPWRGYAPGAAMLLVAVDLVLLGLHVFGGPR